MEPVFGNNAFISRDEKVTLDTTTTTSDDYASYVLNEKNKRITEKFIHELLLKYGVKYRIKDMSLFQRAMVHSSYLLTSVSNDRLLKMIKEKNLQPLNDTSTAIPLQEQSYETLEYLGDSVIHLILASYLKDRYPDKDEGFLTKLRTKIENGTTLAQLARWLGLHEYVLISRSVEVTGRDKNSHIFEDTFEAYLGALFVDSDEDYKLCKKFVIAVIEAHIDFAHLIHNETNHKDTLLQYFHKMKWPDPKYELLETTERNSKKYFTMYVSDGNGKITGKGTGTSKKRAEQIAAFNVLKHYGVVTENEESDDEEFIYNID
jgi:dsRNA-specific ribonuclease